MPVTITYITHKIYYASLYVRAASDIPDIVDMGQYYH